MRNTCTAKAVWVYRSSEFCIIFLINRVFDLIFKKKDDENMFFYVWSLINQWIGIFACAIAFCSLSPDFVNLFRNNANLINIGLLATAVSGVLQEMVNLIVISINSRVVKRKIINEYKNRK